jgi:tetratricopeptide (TPR) repeat protein
MAVAQGILGEILFQQPDGAAPALAAYERAVELLDPVVRSHPQLADQAYRLAILLGDMNVVRQHLGKLDSALASCRKGMEIFERLDRQFPGVLSYQQGLAGNYNMMSDLHRHRREPADSLDFAQKGKTLLERLVSAHPEDTSLRIDLAKSYNNIGRMSHELGEPAEALRALQHAVDLYESVPQLDPRNTYNLACNVALCIPLIGLKGGSQDAIDTVKLSKDDQLRRQRYGDRAVDALRRATDGGFASAEYLQSDSDLDAIRDRNDFQDLMNAVEHQRATAKAER